ncbi:phosphopantothenoylcysteine decarboxylase domain-containing protein [Limnoglobus roseus]|uniref:Phosphopantothenoylcysteine decarboxylase n=1 Tax=Limnoglobus roseus TaxID=2598579 RepID=A0A5C1ALX2_9BACT|nr:phosphopantothenoylcysteine decarboxylase [Limnoglobus roseus]QEL20211.1 phosphopantothenoylcysteine decarboxylase [Limnoglobus roseus]
MNILVTAGNTQTPIDRVRCITNIFSGRTGATIATKAAEYGHAVTLFTSHPDVVEAGHALCVQSYRTFEDLESLMAGAIPGGGFDAIVHAAAVNDYHVVGTFAKKGEAFVDVSAGKVKGHHADLWLRLTPAPKLIDKVRTVWHFAGTLVKFKLEVGVTEAELLDIAERSRTHSGADLMVANTLDGMKDWAYLGAGETYHRVTRSELASKLLAAVEARHTSDRLD